MINLLFLQLIRPVEESEFVLPAICPTIYKWYHLLKEQRAISDVCPSGPGTPGEMPLGPSVSIDTALNGDPNHAATAVKQYSWRINSSSVIKYWSKISGLTLTSLRDGNIPKPKMPRPSINNSKLTINSPIFTGIMNDLPSDNIIQSNNKYQLVEDAPLCDCKRVYGYDIMCRNSVLQNQMAYFTCGITNTEPLNWSISNYQSVDNVQHQAQYLHDVSGHMSAEHLISAIETGCIQGVKLTSKLKDAIVNGTFYNTYSEFHSWISDLCNSSKFTKTKDVKDYQDLIKLKQGSESKVDAIPDMHKTMSYYERIRLALMKKSTFTL